MIKIYKQSNNGEVGVMTNCIEARNFVDELSSAVVEYINKRNEEEGYSDQERDMDFLLSNAFEIMLKLKGYKNEGLSEQRVLYKGDSWPGSDETPVVEIK